MENREKWTLTILRIGSDDFSSDLEDAQFRFGRHKRELSDPEQDATSLPSGLVELVREANLEEQALETGFAVELSTIDRLCRSGRSSGRQQQSFQTYPGGHQGPFTHRRPDPRSR